jgi:hypothetical protein
MLQNVQPSSITHSLHVLFLCKSYTLIMILPFKVALAALSWLGIANAEYYAITGVHDGVGINGTRPARLNINTLQSDPYAW